MHKIIFVLLFVYPIRVTTKVKSMKIEFTRAEIERILLAHANSLIEGYSFNQLETRYSSMPSSITVSKKEEEDAAQ